MSGLICMNTDYKLLNMNWLIVNYGISIQYVIVFFHLINLIKKQVWNLFENNCKNYYIKQIIWVFLTLFLNYNTKYPLQLNF